jgi:putative peptidoglycan lipid II flippase
VNLLKAASTVSLLTLVSRITGLVREQVMAAAFGASAMTDAFNVAFRLPNLLRRLFAEGAFSQAFVPLLARTRETDGDAATRTLIDAIATVLTWALLLTVAIGIVAAPVLIWLLASGLAAFDPAVLMARMMFPYIACMSLVALAAGVLNTWRNFAVPAATPVLLNLCWIAAAWLLAPQLAARGIEPIYAVAAGVMVGGLLQLAVQVPALRRIGMLPRIGLAPAAVRAAGSHPGVGRVLTLMAPALLGVSVAQVSLLINTQIASHLAVGSVSWLSYADRLMEFPTALLGVAMGVVLLPQLSAAQARGDAEASSRMIDWGLRLVLMLALPCAAALLVFAQPMVAVLYHYGRFGAGDVGATVQAMAGYGVGLIGLIAIKVLAPAYYARQDVKTPVRIAIVVLIVTQALNLLLVPWLAHAGLALSIGLGALVNALWLLIGLRKRGAYQPSPGWGGYASKIAVATALMTLALWLATRSFDWIALQAMPWQRAGLLSAAMAAAAALYFGCLALLGLDLKRTLKGSA